MVRRLVTEHGLDADQITGTGPGGRITRDDVLDHIDKQTSGQPAPAAAPPAAPAAPAAPAPAPRRPAAQAPAVAPGERDRTVKLSRIRKVTGAHMVMSLGVSPHSFSVVEVDYANVDATRSAVKDEWKRSEGFSLTYLPFITRAVVEAIEAFPNMNASIGEDEIVVHQYIDMGIAVDLDYEGLIVPVVRGAEGKRLRAIAREISDLAARAHSKKLGPDEISGGTFTITNNGSAGSVLTFPIINQPQAAILSTDAIVRKPVVAKLPDGSEAIAIHPVGNLAMAWDHRVFDGAYAAELPRQDQGGPGDPRLERRAVSCCTSAGSAGCRTARRSRCSRPCSTTGVSSTCCCSSIRTCSPTARGRTSMSTSRCRRSRSVPSWCGSSAVATSPTTAPASWSATRS